MNELIELFQLVKMCDFLDLNKEKYAEVDQIGQGSFSTVYKIIDKSNGQVLAAKISLTQINEVQKSILTNLKREVNIISKLNHPSILKFYGYSPTDFNNSPYPVIITEYASNGTLQDIIRLERRSLSPTKWNDTKKLINIYGIASAMSFLHSHNIVHRDLKPANILEDDYLFPKIADFGLSKINHSNIESMSTKSTPGIKGTPIYIPPEVWDDNAFTKAGDVYSFSFIVYEILTLEEPFKGISIGTLCNKVLYKCERPEFKYPIASCYKELITRCWSQEPIKRPTFDQIVYELKNNESFITECVDEDEYRDYIELIDSLGSSFDMSKSSKKLT